MKTWILSAIALTAVGCSAAKTNPEHTAEKKSAAAPAKAGSEAKNDKKPQDGAKAAADGMVVCTHKEDERKLEIVSEKTGCVVKYTKHQQASNIASDSHGDDHCHAVMNKVRGNLEGAGFHCK